MLNTCPAWLSHSFDRWLGRGSAAITVPVMDGVLKPNRALDHAEVVAKAPGLDDLASNSHGLWLSAANVLCRWSHGSAVEVLRFDAEITALAASEQGDIAVALGGQRVLLLRPDENQLLQECAVLSAVESQALQCVNALAFEAEGQLLMTEGSARHTAKDWCHDLMELGHTGRVLRWHAASSQVEILAAGLRYAYGLFPTASALFYSESWGHHLRALGHEGAVLSELPAFPSRMAPATGGGFWLCCFICRTQLVEFVLREPAYRQRMLREVDPRYWIAPALSTGQSFLEPLQGAGVKQMGVVKPWAPPRSYGLVLRVSADGRVRSSLHSQVDGKHHGITAVQEHDGALWVVSKGSECLLRIPLQDLAEMLWMPPTLKE
jgi:hypothetical protein